MNICKNCNAQTANLLFCSRSCAASYNNKHSIKRKWHCKKCHLCKPKFTTRLCHDCYLAIHDSKKDLLYKTVGDLELYYASHNQHRQNIYTYIRERARNQYAKIFNKCIICGYNKHIEISHIIPISRFPPETLIEEINALSNIIPLCPNCHWEFDHNLIDNSTMERVRFELTTNVL